MLLPVAGKYNVAVLGKWLLLQIVILLSDAELSIQHNTFMERQAQYALSDTNTAETVTALVPTHPSSVRQQGSHFICSMRLTRITASEVSSTGFNGTNAEPEH